MIKWLFLFVFLSHSLFSSPEEDFQSAQREWIKTAEEAEKTFLYSSKALTHIRNTNVAEQFRQKISEIELELKKDTRNTISYVSDFIKKNQGQVALDDDLIMRLAQLYYQEANYSLQEKMDQYHTDLNSYYAGRVKKLPDLPKPNFQKTLEYSKRLLKNFPESEFASYAIYLVGVIQEENGNYEESLSRYKKIISDYPYSKHKDEALWRSAELSFDFSRFKEAANYYKELIERNSSVYKNKAYYKLGAIEYMNQNFKEAERNFSDLLSSLQNSSDGIEMSLKMELYEYLGLLYLKGIRLENYSSEVRLESLKAVAKRLERHNQYSYARRVYRNYIASNYFNPQVSSYYELLVESLEGDDKIAESIQTREKWLKHIRPGGKWWTKNSEGEAQFFAEESRVQNKIFLARYFAEKGIESGKRSDILRARNMYRDFVKNERYSQEIGTAYYELAQIEERLGDYSSARKNYQLALNSNLDKNDIANASYSLFFAEVKASNHKLASVNKKNLFSKNERSLDAKDIKLIQLYNSIEPKLETTEYKVPLQYYVAQIYLSKNEVQKAKQFFSDIIDIPKVSTEQITYLEDSAKWLVEVYSHEKNWDEIAKVNEKLKSKGTVSDLNLESVAEYRFNNSVLNEAEVLEEQGKFSLSAKAFEDFVKKNPKNFESDQAYLKAAALYRADRKYSDSNRVLTKILKSDLRPDALSMYSQNLLDSFQFAEALRFTKTFTKKDFRAKPKLKNINKLVAFLTTNQSIAEKFELEFKRTKDISFGIRAAKEFMYSSKFVDANRIIKKLSQRKLPGLEMKAIQILSSILKENNAETSCNAYFKSYQKLKKVSQLEFNVWHLCNVSNELTQSGSISNESLAALFSEGAYEAYIFAKLQRDSSQSDFTETLNVARVNNLAIINLVEQKSIRAGLHKFKRFEIFPFHAARAEAIPWRPLVKNNKEFDIEAYCKTNGYGSCYLRLSAFAKKGDTNNYDLLTKIALILDRETEANRWAKLWSENGGEVPFGVLDKISTSVDKTIARISTGRSSLNEYFILAKSYYDQKNYRKANFVVSTFGKLFPENPLAQASAEFLQGRSVKAVFTTQSDPRIWYLDLLDGNSSGQNYLSLKRLIRGSEWYKSLRVAKKVMNSKESLKASKSQSEYYKMLSFYLDYQSGRAPASSFDTDNLFFKPIFNVGKLREQKND